MPTNDPLIARWIEKYAQLLGILAVILTLSACSSTSVGNKETENSASLIQVAQRFNDDYRLGNFGAVYDRWNSESQSIITRADYIRRHVECPNNPQATVQVVSAVRGTDNVWRVKYTISGMEFTDYWSYLQGRWIFDLRRSNPEALALYKLSFAGYALRLGCVHS